MAVPEVLVGTPTGTPSTNISAYIEPGTLKTEDTGNQTDDTANFEVTDKAIAVTALVPNGRIKTTRDSITIFNGFITTLEPTWRGIGRRLAVSCTSISTLLDKCIIPAADSSVYIRSNHESDKSRIQWLLNTFGDPFLTAGSSSFTYIQVLDPHMDRQNFANLTLRQAIERVLGAASESANYYVDTLGRVHTWDNDNLEALVAPFDVVAEPTLAANEVAPSDLRVMWDTSELVNYYFVRGTNAAGSGAYSDATSISTYGRWQSFIDGPDSDSVKKARRLGKAALKDTKNPIVRTAFTVDADYCENGSGEIWLPGQVMAITSAAHGMTAYEQRIFRVTTSYLNSLGDRSMAIEGGALRLHGLGGGVGGGSGGGGGGSFYPDPTLVVQPGPPVVTDPPDGDPTPGPGGSTDNGEYEIEDWTGSATGSPDLIEHQTTLTSGTSHVVGLTGLPGLDIANDTRWLVLGYSSTAADALAQIPSQIVIAGFTQLQTQQSVGSNSNGVFVQPLDGTQLYASEDNTLTFTTPGSENFVWTAVLVGGVAEWTSIEVSGNDPLGVSGWAGEIALSLVWGFDDAAVAGIMGGQTLLDSQVSGAAALRVAHGTPTGAFNPGAWTMTGTAQWSTTIAGRYTDPGWGNTLRGQGVDNGAPWVGANTWFTGVDQGSALFTTTATTGVITIVADDTAAYATLKSDSIDEELGEAWGPWADADGTMRCKWKVNRIGILTDAFSNIIEWLVEGPGYRGTFRAHLGDSIDYVYADPEEIGIVILQGSILTQTASPFVTKALTEETYYQTRMDFRGERARMKLWEDGVNEPVAWDIDVAKIADEDTGSVARFHMRLLGGTTAFDLIATYDTLWGTASPASGSTGGQRTVLPRGDGVTTTWTIGAFAAGSLRVYVDGMLVLPSAQDPVAGTFTFDRAPALGSWVEAEWADA